MDEFQHLESRNNSESIDDLDAVFSNEEQRQPITDRSVDEEHVVDGSAIGDAPAQEDDTSQQSVVEQYSKHQREKSFKRFGMICMLMVFASLFFLKGASIDQSQAAKDALTNRTSVELAAGVVLSDDDEAADAMDYTIEHQSEDEETKLWVWDYADQDGDYVQLLVDGAPLDDSFMILNEPRAFTVPSVGDIQIEGVHDGGGGITYGIYYELNGTSYFNTAPEGEFNTYSLVRGK